ncbi:Uncharacterized protein PODLI_1B008200, partial [Podarcis lilfordi]
MPSTNRLLGPAFPRLGAPLSTREGKRRKKIQHTYTPQEKNPNPILMDKMDTATHVMKKKRPHEDNEKTEKVKKRRKVDESDVCQNQQKAKSDEKQPRLSAKVFGEDSEISYDQLYRFLNWCRVHHRKHLAGIVVVVLRDVGQLHFDRFYLQFKHLRRIFRH